MTLSGSLRASLAVCLFLALTAQGTMGASDDPHERVHELDPMSVVSTATRTDRLRNELPIRTELVTSEQFLSSGIRDLAAAFQYLPGARVEANCQNCGTTEVKLRGLGAGYNQLLFEEQPLFSGLASVYGLEHIPTAFIERIEVVKGGASSVYGPGAVAGVINIIPHEPVISRIDFETGLELFDGAESVAGVGVFDAVTADNRLAGTLYGEYRRNGAIDLNGDGFSEITRKDFHTIGTNAWAYPVDDARISANYAYTWENRRGGDRFDLLPHEAQITEELEHRWHRGGLFWEHDASQNFSYKVGGSVSDIDRDSYYGGVGAVPLPGQPGHDPAEYAAALDESRLLYGYTRTTRYYLDSIFTHRFGEHAFSWGGQYQHDDVFDEKRDDQGQPLRSDGSPADAVGEDPIADGAFDNTGFFLQDEWDPSADWTVIGGLRTDRHSELDKWVVSPRAAIRRTLNQELTLRGSIAAGFRAPEIFDEDFHIEILDDPTRTRNPPGLKEERSLSYAGGFVWTPAAADNRLMVDVELFRTVIRDTFNVSDIVHTDEFGNAFKLRENAGGSTVQGFEANALYSFSDALSVEGGVSFTDARFDEPQEVLPGIFEDRYLETPRWTGVAQLNYTNDRLFNLFVGLIYTGPMIVAREVEQRLNPHTDRFFVVDVTMTKHFKIGEAADAPHIDLTLGVRNLFDERQNDLTSGPDRDTTYFYGPRFPRSYVATLRLHF